MNGKESTQIQKNTDLLSRIDERIKIIHTNINDIKIDIKEMKSGTSTIRNACMSRFEKIEGKMYMAYGGLTILSVLGVTKVIGLW